MQQISRQPAKDSGSCELQLVNSVTAGEEECWAYQANAEAAHPAAAMTGGFMKNWQHDA